MPNSFIKVYLNGTLIHTEPYDIVPVTSAPICFYAMTTATRTDHEIYVVIEATAPQAMTMYELTYTIQGKNVNFLFSYPTYQIASNNSNYRIIKRVGKVYSYLDTLQTPLDLSGGYTALTTKTYFESPLYLNTVGTYPGPSYNRNFFYFQHDHYTGKGLLQNANFETQGTFSGYYPCDPVCLTNFELSVYIGVATSDTTFKIIRHRTDTYAVNDYIPTQTMETKIINITMVKNHWSKYSSAKQPIPLIQLRNGRNYAYIPSISTLLYLGYGTKISGGFSNNQNIDFKVYLKQYDHWVCEEITVTDTTASVTNTTTIEANYDEMHPGIDNEVFIVSNGVFTKLS